MKRSNLKLFAILFATVMITFTACNKEEETKIDVSGIVTDAATNDALEGVIIKSGTEEVTTATDGSYTINVEKDGLLSFEKEGYTTKTEAVNNRTTIDVAIDPIEGSQNIVVTENIDADTIWEAGNVYTLAGRITVLSGVTLTIEPGVIIKGEAGTGPNATALLIARGATLLAEGTANEPIIFTSVADEIEPGQIASPNLDPSLNGLWGGLIVLGNAPISADATSVQIEGIPPSDQNGLYGGDDPGDNSGIIKYVSIRHGGANIGEGNEINGLTLGGVGSGTVIENIEIIANQDDGIEWFGGKVNVKNVVAWNVGDDAIDTDQSWGGTLDNFIVINPGDECFELDGPEGTMEDGHTIKNGSVKAMDAEGLVDLDDNSIVELTGIYFFELAEGQDFDLVPTGLIASNLQATIPDGFAVTDFFVEGSDAFVTEVGIGANTVGADVSVFQNWTWASQSGNLDDF